MFGQPCHSLDEWFLISGIIGWLCSSIQRTVSRNLLIIGSRALCEISIKNQYKNILILTWLNKHITYPMEFFILTALSKVSWVNSNTVRVIECMYYLTHTFEESSSFYGWMFDTCLFLLFDLCANLIAAEPCNIADP